MNGTPATRPLSCTPGTVELDESLQPSSPKPAPPVEQLLLAVVKSSPLAVVKSQPSEHLQSQLGASPQPHVAAESTVDINPAHHLGVSAENSGVQQPSTNEHRNAECTAPDGSTDCHIEDPMVLDGEVPNGEDDAAVYEEALIVAALVEGVVPEEQNSMQDGCPSTGALTVAPSACTPAAAMAPEPDIGRGSLTSPATGTRAPASTPLNYLGELRPRGSWEGSWGAGGGHTCACFVSVSASFVTFLPCIHARRGTLTRIFGPFLCMLVCV